MQPSMPRKASSSSTVDPDYEFVLSIDLIVHVMGGFYAIVLLVELVLYAI